MMKQAYAGVMQGAATFPPLRKWTEAARREDAYGWQRWTASLLAIHDVRKMIALDLPWWNVAATQAVDRHLARRPGARVFEYGSGASTNWLAKRAGSVVTVEHHAGWHALLVPIMAKHASIRLWSRDLEGDDYVGAINDAGGTFDLIVIDGRRRIECLNRALPHLKPDGIILFDDSGRRRYRAGIKACGLKELRHFGLSYCVPYPDFTSILHA